MKVVVKICQNGKVSPNLVALIVIHPLLMLLYYCFYCLAYLTYLT